MAPLNGIDHGNAHSAIGDVIATLGVAKLIAKKAPNVWKASLMTLDKNQTLELIKKEIHFCTNGSLLGRRDPHVPRRRFRSACLLHGRHRGKNEQRAIRAEVSFTSPFALKSELPGV